MLTLNSLIRGYRNATISFCGFSRRTAQTATCIVAPVATPSSVKITIRPFNEALGKTARIKRLRRLISAIWQLFFLLDGSSGHT